MFACAGLAAGDFGLYTNSLASGFNLDFLAMSLCCSLVWLLRELASLRSDMVLVLTVEVFVVEDGDALVAVVWPELDIGCNL